MRSGKEAPGLPLGGEVVKLKWDESFQSREGPRGTAVGGLQGDVAALGVWRALASPRPRGEARGTAAALADLWDITDTEIFLTSQARKTVNR